MWPARVNSARFQSILWLSGGLLLLVTLCALMRPPAAGAMTLPAAATPDEAVQFAVQHLGGTYAGACEGAARSSESRGKMCSRYVAACGDVRAYLLGRTFSEYNTWLFIVQAHDGWHFARTESLALTGSLTDVPWPIDIAAEDCP